MGGLSITPIMAAHLATLAPGTTVNREELVTATGLTPSQVTSVMYRLAGQEDPPVEVVARGHVWRVPEPPDTDDGSAVAFDVIEHLGGALVLRDAEGALWLAKRIGTADA